MINFFDCLAVHVKQSYHDMIPDFPEAKAVYNNLLARYFSEQVKNQTPIANAVTNRNLYEGNSMLVLRPDGSSSISMMKRESADLVLTKEEASTISNQEFLGKVTDTAQQIAQSIEKGLLECMSDAINTTGNVIKVESGLTPKVMLDALEKIKFGFKNDNRETPENPSMVVDSATLDNLLKIEKNLPEAEKILLQKRFQNIMDQKYKEHLEDLESRKIID